MNVAQSRTGLCGLPYQTHRVWNGVRSHQTMKRSLHRISNCIAITIYLFASDRLPVTANTAYIYKLVKTIAWPTWMYCYSISNIVITRRNQYRKLRFDHIGECIDVLRRQSYVTYTTKYTYSLEKNARNCAIGNDKNDYQSLFYLFTRIFFMNRE